MKSSLRLNRCSFVAAILVCLSFSGFLPISAYADSSVIGWGKNQISQINVPSPNSNFIAIAAYNDHSLGLKQDGSIAAWGDDGNGESTVPSPNADFKAIAAGNFHSLGLKNDGSIVAWGSNGYGQRTVPEPNTNFKAVAAGSYHSLGLKNDGSIVAWGDNYYGQLNVPSPDSNFIAIAAGDGYSLGLKNDGSIVAWGRTEYGLSTAPSPNTDFKAIAAGPAHSLALKNDGSIVAWGWNLSGQNDIPSPNTGFKAIADGFGHCLGLKNDGSIVAWGSNNNGQLNVPSPNADFTAIAAGSFHSLALKANNPRRFGNIPGIKKNTKLTVNDSCDTHVTFALTGSGYGEVSGDANDIVNLYNTTEKSMLTISTPKGKTTTISSITVNGFLKGIMAKTTNLNGDITLTGSLGTLTLKDAKGSISIGGTLLPTAVAITFNQADDLNINSDIPIKSITALGYWWGTLTAPAVGSITSKSKGGYLAIEADVDGDIGTIKTDGLEGSWNCQSVKSVTASGVDDFYLTLSQILDTKKLALGNMTIKGGFTWSRILSSGNIGTVTFGMIQGSNCFAGVTATRDGDENTKDGVLDLPNPNTDINPAIPATIKSIKINGIKGQTYGMINSNIAAANILSAYFAYPDYDNGGTSFGIAADSIKSLKIKDAAGTHSVKGPLNLPGDGAVLTSGDFKINIK